MLQKTFELQAASPKIRIIQLELGLAHITINTFNAALKPIGQLEHFNFKPTENQDWSTIWKDLQTQSTILSQNIATEKIVVTWENDLVQPVPTSLFNIDHQINYFQFNQQSINTEPSSFKHLTDTAGDYSFVYSVPLTAYQALERDYPSAIHQHKQAAITRKIGDFTDQYQLKALLVFYQNHFILTTFKAGELQLILSRTFNHGADIVYHLLNAIRQAGFKPDQCCVYLSGLIDGDSALFKEIYKFVPVIDVDKMPDMDFLTDHPDYPSHFFVPFYKYIQDVLV